MTPIPGTSEIKIPKSKPVTLEDTGRDVHTFVNIKELKTPQDKDDPSEADIWYYELKYWVLFGTIPSVIFALFALKDVKFLFLTPLGPYAAYLTWHIRKKIKFYVKKFDSFS